MKVHTTLVGNDTDCTVNHSQLKSIIRYKVWW